MKQIPCRKTELRLHFSDRPVNPGRLPPSTTEPDRYCPLPQSGLVGPTKASQVLLCLRFYDRLRFSASAARRKKSFTPIRAVIQSPSLGDKAESARTGRIG
jgi:hypothetical protein